MRKYLTIIIPVFLTTIIMAITPLEALDNLVAKLEIDSYSVDRYVEESGIIPVFRVENVLKSGLYKVVSVSTPVRDYKWVHNSFGQFVILDTSAFEPVIPIKDVEDSFLEVMKRKNYKIVLSLDLPGGYKVTLEENNISFEVTFTSDFRLTSIVKRYPFYRVSVSYRNYRELTDENRAKISSDIFGKDLIRPPIKLENSFFRNTFQWVSMDFSVNGNSSIYALFLYSSEYGKLTLFFIFNGSSSTLETIVDNVCDGSDSNYYMKELSPSTASALIGPHDVETLSAILVKLLGENF